jgi:hypothetical protein
MSFLKGVKSAYIKATIDELNVKMLKFIMKIKKEICLKNIIIIIMTTTSQISLVNMPKR